MKNLFNFIILILILLVLILLGSIFFGDKNYNLRDNLKIENDLQKNINQELIKSNEILEFEIKNGNKERDFIYVDNLIRYIIDCFDNKSSK